MLPDKIIPGNPHTQALRTMKKAISLVSLLLLLVSCNTELQPVDPELQPKTAAGLVFYASFENQSIPGTKVFMNEDWELRWNAGDEISVFNKTADNLQFGFSGEEGAAGGSFAPVNPNAVLAGAEVPHIYAVYPYANGTTVSADGTISLTLPAEQAYYGGVSFGRGANTMVSVTEQENEKLLFKNACGYVQFKLYGEGAAVTRVTLKGNNNELLAGPASVTASTAGVPDVTMGASATKEVSVVCAEPVALGSNAEHYTTFLLAIPPTTFEKGFTITVTDSDGYTFEKSTANRYTVERNAIFPMAPLCCRKIEEFEIENNGVRDYRINVDYSSDPDYSTSAVDQYRSTASDDSRPFTVTSVSGASKVKVRPLTAPYRANEEKTWNSFSVASSSVNIYNLIPGVVYHYEILNGQNTVLKSGFVSPTGQIRMINGFSYNVRDMGGWQASGGTIAYGKLYRGAQLNGISNAGKTIFLNDLGISIDLDLRRNKTGESPTDALNLGTNGYTNIQVLKFFDNGSGNTGDLYQKAIRDIIGWLSEGKAVYLHCVGGADRTGTLAFLIEALVGVSESDLSKDYELTSFDGSHTRRRSDPGQGNTEYILKYLINYLRQFEGSTINEKVVNWATTPYQGSSIPALTATEISQLQTLLVAVQ